MKKVFLFLIFPFSISAQTAFISGNDTICDNGSAALVKIDFNGAPPFTFVYSIDGINQPSDPPTNINPYIISTKIAGSYTLVSFNDANSFGSVSGSGLVTILESPKAIIHLLSDTFSIISPTANFISQSIGNVISWQWDFGDNTFNESIPNPYHTYNDSSAIYSASLIVIDENGCADTAIHTIWVGNEFWIYIPNSFTPDLDGLNDKFCIEYSGIRESTFLFKVFNSQGSLMYQSANSLELKCSQDGGWAGKNIDRNIDLPSGIFAYEIYFQDFEGWKHKEYGTIILVR